MSPSPVLVADGIENPWNARALCDAAALFGTACLFRDQGSLARAWSETIAPRPAESPGSPGAARQELQVISREALQRDYAPIVALDNLPGAQSVYGFRLPGAAGCACPAVVVGNERRGVSRAVQALADCAIEIPMASRSLNCLNVAAAAAVALYYVTRGGGGVQVTRAEPQQRRPEVMLVGPAEHVEAGSAIRSAGAFGWGRLFVEDRHRVWFGASRPAQSEGRAAARRRRNPIRVVPAARNETYLFEEVCVVTLQPAGAPLHRAGLAGGPNQLIALPDESCIDVEREAWGRLGRDVRFVHLDLPARASPYPYRYRLVASIALAEIARQVGRPTPPVRGRARRPAPLYDSALELLAEARGETVFLEDLEAY